MSRLKFGSTVPKSPPLRKSSTVSQLPLQAAAETRAMRATSATRALRRDGAREPDGRRGGRRKSHEADREEPHLDPQPRGQDAGLAERVVPQQGGDQVENAR